MKEVVTISAFRPERGRFARFELIGWWDQKRLAEAKIVVIGAGALGNEILKNLALLGVGNIFIADMDVIEDSNLSRSVLYRPDDVGRSKAEVAAAAARRIYPDAKVQWFHGNVVYDLGLGVYEWADIVMAGLDNREARLAVNQSCWKTNTPWIDGAIEVLNGVARAFIPPDGPCYECTMGEADWKMLESRRSCNLLTREEIELGKVPTTPTTSSVIAGIQCQEAVKLLHDLDVMAGKGFVFNGTTCDSYTVAYSRKDDCYSHETYHEIRKLEARVSDTTLKELLMDVKDELGDDAIIEFNNEILHALECPQCEKAEAVFTSLGKVAEREGACPDCGEARNARTLHSIDGNEGFLDKTFADVGVPPFDVVVGRSGMDQIFLQFAADGPAVLGPLCSG